MEAQREKTTKHEMEILGPFERMIGVAGVRKMKNRVEHGDYRDV